MTIRLVSNEKIAETSSKGNQEKWLEHGRWYKLDQFGYEALAETFTSLLLARSRLEQDTPFALRDIKWSGCTFMAEIVLDAAARISCGTGNPP
mgnify:CR=1 FL=1